MRPHPLLALEQLAPQCAELQELRPLCERARDRLTALAAQLEVALDDDSARVDALIARLTRFVARGASSNAVRRLTDVHRLRELYELQLALDAAFRASGIAHADPARDWREQWQGDVDFAEQQLHSAVLDRELLRLELQRDAEQQREALALVKFAAENLVLHGDADEDDEQREHRVARTRLLKRVFRLLLSVADVEVPVLPAWFISPNDVATHAITLSSDPSAEVCVGEWLPLAKTVIVKQFNSEQQRQAERAAVCEMLLREAETWYPLNHPNVLKLVGGCHVSTPLFLVYESPEGDAQTLDALVSDASTDGPFSGQQIKVFHVLFQVALALQYLHEQHGLVHNDIMCRNVLVSANGKAKLCNFGRTIGDAKGSTAADKVRVLNVLGSLRWTSPESLRHEHVGFASDIYAFGMCIMEAISGGDIPWGFADDHLIRTRVAAGELPERDERIDDEAWALITSMCSLDPESRPSIAAVVASLNALAEKERQQSLFEQTSRSVAADSSSQNSEGGRVIPADYDTYRRQVTHSHRGSISDTRSVSSGTSGGVTKSEPQRQSADTMSVVTLHQKWLGIKINSIGTKIVVSKFLRSASGAMGEIEASGTVQLGDIIYAVNGQTVRGMDRHKIGAFIQSTPRPLNLSFKREAGLLDECFRFNGLRLDERWRDRGSVLPLPGSLDRLTLSGSTSGAFSLEIWFSLADATDSFLGGVLLGAQDVAVDDSSWPYIHKQLVIVDSHGNLCCSMLSGDTPLLIARELTPSIWYHLVVTYNTSDRQFAVYLDGELRHSSTKSLLRDWQRLGYVNVGSGCISGISPAKPTPDFTGWYGFNGLVHDFRIWRSLLGDLEVHQLFRGASDCVDIPNYSMRRDFRKKSLQSVQLPERVQASRPQHVVAQVY